MKYWYRLRLSLVLGISRRLRVKTWAVSWSHKRCAGLTAQTRVRNWGCGVTSRLLDVGCCAGGRVGEDSQLRDGCAFVLLVQKDESVKTLEKGES